MALITCPECGARVSNHAAMCVGCGFPLAAHVRAFAGPSRPLGRLKYLYGAALGCGLLIAGYLYLVKFDDLSETTLIRLTPLWFFLIVLGYYGLVAERMAVRQEKSRLETVADTLFDLIKTTGPGPFKALLLVVHLPFLIVKSRFSFVTALVGAAIWAIALWVFFAVVFPTL